MRGELLFNVCNNQLYFSDIKLDNVMLDASGHVRLADMGMCRMDLSPQNPASTFCGTPDYIAPEVSSLYPAFSSRIEYPYNLLQLLIRLSIGESILYFHYI